MPGPARPVAANGGRTPRREVYFPRGGPDPATIAVNGWERAAPLGTLRAVRRHHAGGRPADSSTEREIQMLGGDAKPATPASRPPGARRAGPAAPVPPPPGQPVPRRPASP